FGRLGNDLSVEHNVGRGGHYQLAAVAVPFHFRKASKLLYGGFGRASSRKYSRHQRGAASGPAGKRFSAVALPCAQKKLSVSVNANEFDVCPLREYGGP